MKPHPYRGTGVAPVSDIEDTGSGQGIRRVRSAHISVRKGIKDGDRRDACPTPQAWFSPEWIRRKPPSPSRLVRVRASLGWLGLLAPLLVSATGCVYVLPVPTAYHPEGSRRNLTEATANQFAPGQTTVAEVVLALGEPDTATDDASRLNYRWERVNMHLSRGWLVAVPDAAIGQSWGTTYSHDYSLSFAFDKYGVLQKVGTTNVNKHITEHADTP